MPVKELDLNLRPMMKRSDLRAKRRVLSRILEGSWTRMVKGRGMEFAGFRKYTYGDDASQIDWNATLRAKETLVREFEEYKNVNIFFILDVSDSMLFSSKGKLKAEYGAELIFFVAQSVLDNGEAIGFAMSADDVIAKLHPGIGANSIYAMANAFEKPKNYGGNFNLKNVVKLLSSFLKERALIFLVSDFLDLDDNWERYIKMISQNYDLIGVMLRDPLDRKMPDMGVQVLAEDPNSGERILIDTAQYREAYEEDVRKNEAYIKSVFEKAEAGFLPLQTDDNPLPEVMRFFKKRTAAIVRR